MTLLPFHQAHDYRYLITRWRAVARAAELRLQVLTEAAGEKIFYLENSQKHGELSQVYLSAGVHGDEPAAAWGLLVWAESHITDLKQGSFLIFPCLNPHGLKLNTRVDDRGLDMNRRFHLEDDPISGPWLQITSNRSLHICLCLHEDYDAQGTYVYELGSAKRAVAAAILEDCSQPISPDPRKTIDGQRVQAGVIRRSAVHSDLLGLPEAIVLWQLVCPLTLTFETPSELSLDDRVQAHAAFVTAALRHVLQS